MKTLLSHLGLIHPIPIFGSHAYFYPPSMLHVDDKQADDTTFEISSRSKNKNNIKSRENRLATERELAERLRKYIPKRIQRCWKVAKGRPSDNIDPEKYCTSLFKGKISKVGYVFPMAVVSILPHAEFGPNGHW